MKARPLVFTGESIAQLQAMGKQRLYRLPGETEQQHQARRLMNGVGSISENGCWVWRRGQNGDGYGTLTIGGRQHYVHRLAYELSKGAIPEGLEVMHECDNPPCINPDHLVAGTRKDNMRDCVRKGRHGGPPPPQLEGKNPAAKLSRAQVRLIKASSNTYRELAVMYGVSPSAVGKIKRGETWQNVR